MELLKRIRLAALFILAVGAYPTVNAMEKNEIEKFVLHKAANKEDLETVKRLIDKGADI